MSDYKTLSLRFRIVLFGALLAAHWQAFCFETQLSLHRDGLQTVRLGDRFIDSVTLHAPLESKEELLGLPQPGPISDSLFLRSSQIRHVLTQGENQTTIELTYQIFKSVEVAEAFTIPAVTLRSTRGEVILIPEWTVTVEPVIGNETPLEDLTVAEMAQPPHLSTDLWVRNGWVAVSSLISITGFGWLIAAFLLYRRAPFARCEKELQKLAKLPPSEVRLLKAIRLLHHAFDRTHGRVMFEEHIEDFCGRIPDFRLLKTNLHTFFKCSRDVFYLRAHRYDPEGTFLFLVELATAAATIEKEKR